MHSRPLLTTALALFVPVGALASSGHATQVDGLRALDGEWLYVEDLTEGRAVEEQQPPMSATFALRVEEDAVVQVRGKGSNASEERIALDDSVSEVVGEGTTKCYRGVWKDGALEYETEILRVSDNARIALIRKVFRPTPDGLHVRVVVGEPAQLDSVALYRHPEDIALPAPAQATMADMEWLTGAWVGTMGSSSIEERWSPPLGGAMLGVSRTVKRGSMVAFEYLRVVERDGGLVYVAQPGGSSPTEFVLTELDATRAVFENPRHDSPQRIVYELSADGSLTASIGFINGGRSQRFEFMREDD